MRAASSLEERVAQQETAEEARALIAAYGFDEGSGILAGDASGNGHVGAIKQAQWVAGGRFGRALDFDGVNDWITVDDKADLDILTAITIEAWVNPRALSGWNTILMKEFPGGVMVMTGANSGIGLRFLWSGTHPFSRWEEQLVSPGERYAWLLSVMQDVARRLLIFGLHVHVGIEDRDHFIVGQGLLRRRLLFLEEELAAHHAERGESRLVPGLQRRLHVLVEAFLEHARSSVAPPARSSGVRPERASSIAEC